MYSAKTAQQQSPAEFIPTAFIDRTGYALTVLLAITLPLWLRHPQLLVGSVVNFALVLTALRTRSLQRTLPMIVLPSVSAVLGGLLFRQPLTAGLLLLIPAIWIGNLLLAQTVIVRAERNAAGFYSALTFGAVAKSGVIFAITLLLVTAGLLPQVMLTTFALLQLLTAALGGALAWPANRLLERVIHQ